MSVCTGALAWSDCCCSVAQSCPTLCNPMDCSTPGFPVLHHLPEFTQTHVHWVGDAIQPSHPLWPPFSCPHLSQHQGLFQWVGSSHQVPSAEASASASVLPMSVQTVAVLVHPGLATGAPAAAANISSYPPPPPINFWFFKLNYSGFTIPCWPQGYSKLTQSYTYVPSFLCSFPLWFITGCWVQLPELFVDYPSYVW